MRNALFLFITIIIALSFIGCENKITAPSDEKMQQDSERSMQEANRAVGMPAIKNWQERKLAKMIFELRDQEKIVCYAYIKSDYQGKLIFIGKCIGYGLPYSVQFTSPQKLVRCDMGPNIGERPMPQADPNGLFMPEGLSATWLMMLDSRGTPRAVYVEPEIVVSPFKLH